MLRSKMLALMILFIGSSSICCTAQCPHNDEVTRKIDLLARDGKATFGDNTYRLISKPETNTYYSGKLLENDTQLNGFLEVTELLHTTSSGKAEAHLLPLLPTPNFCAYKISLGESSHVIALSTTPESSS